MTVTSSALRLTFAVALVGSMAGAQESQRLPRVGMSIGFTRVSFPEVFRPTSSAITASARLRGLQRGKFSGVASVQLVVPFNVTAIEASCPPTADCVSKLSPSSLVGGLVGVERRLARNLTIAGHVGAMSASGMEGGGPGIRGALAADLAWALSSKRWSPVIGLTAVSLVGDLAGAKGFVTPTIGFRW